MTQLLKDNFESIGIAISLLKKGELVAFPTETVYGLGARVFCPSAIRNIFLVKGRPQDNPLIVHVSTFEQIDQMAAFLPKDFFSLSAAFFPGPLTIVLPKNKKVPSIVSGGGETVAIRMPRHPIAYALISEMDEPIVAPSANLSGKPSSTSAQHVLNDFSGKIAAVIDGGSCEVGLESTVISLCGEQPLLLRPGTITRETLEHVLQKSIEVATSTSHHAPLSPGMKYRHYAPEASVYLFHSNEELESHIHAFPNRSRKIVHPTAETLYAQLRLADAEQYEEVLIICNEHVRSHAALMNRLSKAAEKTIDPQRHFC